MNRILLLSVVALLVCCARQVEASIEVEASIVIEYEILDVSKTDQLGASSSVLSLSSPVITGDLGNVAVDDIITLRMSAPTGSLVSVEWPSGLTQSRFFEFKVETGSASGPPNMPLFIGASFHGGAGAPIDFADDGASTSDFFSLAAFLPPGSGTTPSFTFESFEMTWQMPDAADYTLNELIASASFIATGDADEGDAFDPWVSIESSVAPVPGPSAVAIWSLLGVFGLGFSGSRPLRLRRTRQLEVLG